MLGTIRRLLERRSSSGVRRPADWLSSALGGASSTISGIDISPNKALTLSSYFAALRAVSEDVGKLPLILYKRLEPRGKERASGHPLYKILHDAPNGEMSSMSLRETLTMHALSWGGGYAEITRDRSGRATGLWIIDPSKIRLERNEGNQLEYIVRPGAGDEVTLNPRNVFHLRGLSFDGINGYSIASLARESIGAALAAEKSGAALFGNNSRPGAILETAGRLSSDAKAFLMESWEAAHKGPDKAHKVAILEQGLQIKPIAIPNKDAQWLESRQFSVQEMCRWLRLPPHKIGELSRATFSNIEQQSIEYVVDTLQPWLVRWEQEIARKLIPARSGLFAEHLVDGLLRGDTKTRYDAYQTAIQSGWMSRNEARSLENLNPEPGLDTFLEPLNSGPVGFNERPNDE